jgi:hypothetical protein
MSVSSLPPQAEWPDYLFRVTSSLTFRRDDAAENQGRFVSPVQQVERTQEVALQDAFPYQHAFFDATARHLKCEHKLADPGCCFYSPFISTTISLKYALSVAEIQYRRKAKSITITVIDTTSIDSKPPIWDADYLSELIRLNKSKHDFKDEFLVFGSLNARPEGFKTIKYPDLVYQLGGSVPELLDKQESSKDRFSNYFKDLPRRKDPYTSDQVKAAFKIAHSISARRTILPLTIQVLLLHESAASEKQVAEEIVKIVCDDFLRDEDLAEHFHFVLSVRSKAGREHSTQVYDFFCDEPQLPMLSMTKESRLLHECLRNLSRSLDYEQRCKIRQQFDLSPTALVVRQYTHGYADSIVKSVDRMLPECAMLQQYYQGGPQLRNAYKRLVTAVQGCRVFPLSRLNTMLDACKDNAPKDVSICCLCRHSH